jgi:hypothetical protein
MSTRTVNSEDIAPKGKPVNDSVYSRIITAAVINERFCNLLLNDPEKAINVGYSGETFDMNMEDKLFLSSIRANNLSDFALKLVQARSM